MIIASDGRIFILSYKNDRLHGLGVRFNQTEYGTYTTPTKFQYLAAFGIKPLPSQLNIAGDFTIPTGRVSVYDEEGVEMAYFNDIFARNGINKTRKEAKYGGI